MKTKEQILAGATVHFAELNTYLAAANLPLFPIDTAYVDLTDDMKGEDSIVGKWFKETMRLTEEMIDAIPPGVGSHQKLLQAQLQLTFIENICEIHTKLIKLMLTVEPTVFTVH